MCKALLKNVVWEGGFRVRGHKPEARWITLAAQEQFHMPWKFWVIGACDEFSNALGLSLVKSGSQNVLRVSKWSFCARVAKALMPTSAQRLAPTSLPVVTEGLAQGSSWE